MASVQCKMCGYMVELPEGVTACECPACGSMTTFPKCGSEHTEQLHARAEHFRQRNEFDKALDTYEAIVRETPDDAEAYWGMVLSRFGIEYVEDPVSHERVPTCHRVQYESILSDSNYKSALEYADASQQAVYESEAKRIAEIQKGILSISAQEKPFDVFICYNEMTEGGSRTKDFAIAQDIYYQLTNAGYKVFFSRITLEDKLGQQYEPYIFAALNSAKVMLVVGSKREYFNAVWVKNEWSRYLALMKKDCSRLLIPCYRDMDAYDLPDELSMLQSQDMSKIGFMQDLLRGIKKVFGGDKSSGASSASSQTDSSVAPLMKRIRIFLETGDYEQAIKYCNKVLDKDPENAEVYLLQFLAENRLKSEEELYLLQDDLEVLAVLPTFKQLMKFANAPLKARIQEQINKQKVEKLYQQLTRESKVIDHLSPKEQITILQSNAAKFASLNGYKDSNERKRQYEQQAETIRQQQYDVYNQTVERCVALANRSSTPEEWKVELERFKALSDVVPEAAEMVKQCEENVIVSQYNRAMKLKKAKDYLGAIKLFSAIKGYDDSEKQIAQCNKEMADAVWKAYLLIGGFLLALLLCGVVAVKVGKVIKTNRIRSSVETAYQHGNWLEMESLGEELGKLSSKEEGEAVIARSRELHKKELMDGAELAYKQGNWLEMESLGKELGKLSSKEEGEAVIARSQELHKKKLKEAAESAYQLRNLKLLEKLGLELRELSLIDGEVVIKRFQELQGQMLYMVVDLQTWKGCYSSTGPNLADDTCRTTELWLRRINPGTFTMGSPYNERGRSDGETLHEVTLTQMYYIGVFECTQKQWELVMGSNPSKYEGDYRRPVENVSYNVLRGEDKGSKWPFNSGVDAGTFFGRLRERTGLAFDLPTEAQWEYACRAGTTTALNSGHNLSSSEERCKYLDAIAWYNPDIIFRPPHPVGEKQPNAWGLYDMHGNVEEWCLDWYGSYPNGPVEDPRGAESGNYSITTYRILRGGNWGSKPENCRSASRHLGDPSLSYFNYGYGFGFRVALCF